MILSARRRRFFIVRTARPRRAAQRARPSRKKNNVPKKIEDLADRRRHEGQRRRDEIDDVDAQARLFVLPAGWRCADPASPAAAGWMWNFALMCSCRSRAPCRSSRAPVRPAAQSRRRRRRRPAAIMRSPLPAAAGHAPSARACNGPSIRPMTKAQVAGSNSGAPVRERQSER